jgi:general secretion pathway protein H
MQTSATGDRRRSRGFTLIELLVVITLIAVAVAVVSLALRDPEEAQLDREAERLATLFEMARAEARADGLAASWAPLPGMQRSDAEQFRFTGLPKGFDLPAKWLGAPVDVQMLGAASVRLGPEPFVGAQRVVLSLGSHQRVLATDGLSPFNVQPATP